MRKGKVTIRVSDKLFIEPQRKAVLAKFIEFCANSLALKEDYVGNIVASRHEYGIETTAVSFFDKRTFFVYAKGRSFADILRSIAHELTHMTQHESGAPMKHRLRYSSEYEDDANSTAGAILNAFVDFVGSDIIYEERL